MAHNQNYFWRAEYSDGSFLLEREGEKENSFYDIDQDRLVFFYLEGPGLELKIHMQSGMIFINNELLENGRLEKHYSRGVKYELIQFKKARATCAKIGGEFVHEIVSHNVGWKYTKKDCTGDDVHAQAVVSIDRDGVHLSFKETDLSRQKKNLEITEEVNV